MVAPPVTAAALALASLYARDAKALEQTFDHLTGDALVRLDQALQQELVQITSPTILSSSPIEEWQVVVAQAAIRRVVYKCLDKYQNMASNQVVESALKYHILPVELQQQLATRYGGDFPRTWYQALERLRHVCAADNNKSLWSLLQDHPLTAYVPMQCQACGHVVPDTATPSDAEVGLREVKPTGQELGLRGGWFRGRPRGSKLLQLDCPQCGQVSTWYRSGHPQIILNPHKWGRLCGEQEEWRWSLANYVGVPLRTLQPLDWDHVWSEFRDESTVHDDDDNHWQVLDADARNFACRLDENIGTWTGVWAIHPNPELCQDVTDEYLSTCRHQPFGRADAEHERNMPRYRQVVQDARKRTTGTQSGTVVGHVLHRANLSDSQSVTRELQRAVNDYGRKEWWRVE